MTKKSKTQTCAKLELKINKSAYIILVVKNHFCFKVLNK